MYTLTLKHIKRTYKNNGQHAEQLVRYTLTGVAGKADNTAYDKGADVLDIQVKSSHASICKGSDLAEHMSKDKAERYAYVDKTFTSAYIMNPSEYVEFIKEFGYIDRESAKNGGATKIRLRVESTKMIEWLNARA